jgi:aarF domain-containing kinase
VIITGEAVDSSAITVPPHTLPDTDPDLSLSTSVAIKVLHPRVHKTIRRDIAIMSVFARIIDAFPGMQWFSLPDEVQVFGEMMNMQLDLRVESANLDRFGKNFAKRGKSISFPKSIKLAGDEGEEEREDKREVLVEEFEDALPLKYFLRNGGGPYDYKIANIGLDAFLVSKLWAR